MEVIFSLMKEILLKKLNNLKNLFILTSSVPSFTPTGEWDIYLHLVDG
jgi:hypothetical protein